MMLLSELVSEYCLSRELAGDYEYQLNYAVKRFTCYAGPVDVGELTVSSINQWLAHEQQLSEISDRSRRNIRASLVTLLRFADADVRYDRIRRVKVTQRPPEAWDFDQLKAVADAAKRLPGVMDNGVTRGKYFSTVLWFTFETGLRRSDVWRFNIDRLDQSNRASLGQHKTGGIHVIEITPETRRELELIAQTLRLQDWKYHRTPLYWPHHWSVFYYWVAKARTIAGVDEATLNRALQHIRRTGATAVERSESGAASRYLGHCSGPALARLSYVDPRQVLRPTMPPVVRHHASRPESHTKTG